MRGRRKGQQEARKAQIEGPPLAGPSLLCSAVGLTPTPDTPPLSQPATRASPRATRIMSFPQAVLALTF